MSRILIVEDEPRLASFLEKGLRAAGYATSVAADGIAASAIAKDVDFDLVILDLGLPLRDGFEVLRDIRAAGQRLPVIILTARDEAADRVSGLEAGADDYIGKPFSFAELLARIRARLRVSGSDQEPPEPDAATVSLGGIMLDPRTRWVTVDGHAVVLSAREFELLRTFMAHPNQVLSREQLLSYVWGYGHDPGSNVVDVYVGYLRRKVGTERLQTVRGVGYRFVP